MDNKTKEKIKKNKEKRLKKHEKRKGGITVPGNLTTKTRVIISAAGVLIALIIAFAVLTFLGVVKFSKERSENILAMQNPAEELLEEIPEQTLGTDELGQGVVEHILMASQATADAFGKRPPTIELTDENRADFVKIDSCLIEQGTDKINISFSSEGIPKSDDKFYYLYEMDSFVDVLSPDENYLAKVYKGESAELSCSLLKGTEKSRLYKKFGIAVKVNGAFVPVSSPSFVTNPEVLAGHNDVFMNVDSKKGILIDYNRVHTGQLEDLGVKQAAINIPIASIMGPTTNPLFPSVHYTYNGKSYTFNGVVVAGFDSAVSALTQKGIQITAILLNSYSHAYISLIHPEARSAGVCPYYMFNGATSDGVEILSAVGAFLADRYSGSKHGRISNWVISNEINARKEWNYLKYTDVDTYTREFAKGYRILYNAIKSTSSTARIYISLDQTWDKNLSNSPDYDGRDVMDCFNNYIKHEGNIDWSVAYHPYNIPLTSCKTWASNKNVSHSPSTATISMQNIEVLVNYLNQEEFLNPDGNCRSIMITELGYTSSGSQQMQAAAIAYAYYKIDYYQDIDGLLLNRQTDDATEIAQGLATGITTAGGAAKYSYNVFKYMDTSERDTYTEFAKDIIGISDWKEIIY